MAGSTRYDDLQTQVVMPVEVSGAIFPDSTNAPTKVGNGFSVAYTGVGDYLITTTQENGSTSRTFPMLVTRRLNVGTSGSARVSVQWGTVDESAGTYQVLVFDAADSAVDLTANVSNRIDFALVFRNSSVNYPNSTAA